MKWSNDSRVCFDEDKHIFLLGNKRMEGVTSYIKRYTNPFDEDLEAEKYASRHDISKEVVLAAWEEKRIKSTVSGTGVHELIERWFWTGEFPGNPEGKQLLACNFINDFFLSGKLKPVECEMVVYDEELKIASMIDMIVRNSLDKYFILDWKTNEAIKSQAYNKWMKEPYQMLPDSDYYRYSLQVRLYERMCREYKIDQSYIVHFAEEEYFFYEPTKVFYEL